MSAGAAGAGARSKGAQGMGALTRALIPYPVSDEAGAGSNTNSGEHTPRLHGAALQEGPRASRGTEQPKGWRAAFHPPSLSPAGECQGALNTVPRTLLLGASSSPHALLPGLDPGVWSLFVSRLAPRLLSRRSAQEEATRREVLRDAGGWAALGRAFVTNWVSGSLRGAPCRHGRREQAPT